jgi:hypothetical protein
VVIPYGQEGTASREWNAPANDCNAKRGAGVGDISVVSSIYGGRNPQPETQAQQALGSVLPGTAQKPSTP